MTAEIPDHLKDIEFKPWHFYTTKDRNGKLMHTLTSNFVEETLRKMKLHHNANVAAMPYGENGILVLAEVDIFPEGNLPGNSTRGHASVTRMPREGGQTSFAQLAVTRALSVALRRRLGISKHDIETVIEALGMKPETIQTREYSNNVVEEATELPTEDIGLDLDL